MSAHHSLRRVGRTVVVALVAIVAAAAQAQAATAVDDVYGVPFASPLAVELPGVLTNDTAGGGATAQLLRTVSHGVLDCGADPVAYDLCPDGSFTYTPDAGFTGFDSFTYQVVDGASTSQATVTLRACTGGPTSYVCWQESAYRAVLGELGFSTFSEGFEDDVAWGIARWPLTAPSVLSMAVTWETNHPATNPITTGTGPALTGTYGVYDPAHGSATGTPAECDINNPPDYCLFKDGFTGTRQAGASTLHAVGGYFKGFAQPTLVAILDGGAPISLGRLQTAGHQFLGVVDAGGFGTFRIEETDGKVGQERYVFADDFVFGTVPADTVPPRVVLVGSFADTGDGALSEGEATAAAITTLTVAYSEPVQDTGGFAAGDVTNPANYLLVSDGGDGFETASCSGGVAGTDVAMAVDWVAWEWDGPQTASVGVNGGVALGAGSYRLLVCGSTSIRDWAGNPLDGDGNGVGGDDFVRSFSISANAPPIAASDSFTVTRGSSTSVAAPGVLGNDLDADPLTAELVSGPSHATAFVLDPNGSFSYTHDGLSTTADAFTYRAFDGSSYSAPATVTMTVTAVPLTWYVSPSGSDLADCRSPGTACASLGEAVWRAISGDSIEAAAGVYAESVTLGEDLAVSGAPGAVIDAGGAQIALTVAAGSSASATGFEIRGALTGGVEILGNLTVAGCWIHGNGDGGPGSFGGVSNHGTAAISATTVSGNLGDVSGGVANAGQMEMVNSTVHGNAGSSTSGVDNLGGATLALRYSTVAGNVGNGIRNDGSLTLQGTIVSGHSTANCVTTVTTLGHNLEDADTCGLDAISGDRIGVDPLLGSLVMNASAPPTRSPALGSAAVDGGAATGCPSVDERGGPRPVDGDGDGLAVCDIGAVERGAGELFADGFESGATTGWSTTVGGP